MDKGKFAKKILIWPLLALLALICFTVFFLCDQGEQPKPNDMNQTEPFEGSNTTQPDTALPSTEVDPTQTWPQATDPHQTDILETTPPVVIVQQADADYEQWLAATLIVGVSMEYPDFIPEGIYTTSKTSLEEKFGSDGVFIVFQTNGSTTAVYSKPIPGERAEAGTTDISSEIIGFATFDPVDPTSVDFDSMEPIALEDLGDLIEQSLLIRIYAN